MILLCITSLSEVIPIYKQNIHGPLSYFQGHLTLFSIQIQRTTLNMGYPIQSQSMIVIYMSNPFLLHKHEMIL